MKSLQQLTWGYSSSHLCVTCLFKAVSLNHDAQIQRLESTPFLYTYLQPDNETEILVEFHL